MADEWMKIFNAVWKSPELALNLVSLDESGAAANWLPSSTTTEDVIKRIAKQLGMGRFDYSLKNQPMDIILQSSNQQCGHRLHAKRLIMPLKLLWIATWLKVVRRTSVAFEHSITVSI